MPGRFDTASDPTDRTLQRLHDAIQLEAKNAEAREVSDKGPREHRPRRKRDLTLVVSAAAIMTLIFIMLLVWLR